MLYRYIVAPRFKPAHVRNYTERNVMPIRQAFFPLLSHFSPLGRNYSLDHGNASSMRKDADALLQKAQLLEKVRNYKEAEEIYKTVIYKIDPSCKEAYDHLINLWGKISVFGFTQKKMDDLFNQYDKHVKVQVPSQITQKLKPK